MSDNFFKTTNIWQKIQRYFSRSNIQTTDSQTSELHVKTTPHNWFHTVMPSSWTWYNSEIYPQERLRKKRIQDYNMMDEDGDITNALNIYADAATQVNLETGHTIKVSGNYSVKREIEDFLYETILFDEQAWGLARDLCKYGDAAFELVLDNTKEDITKLVAIPIEGFRRIEINRVLKQFQFDPKLLMLQGMQQTDVINYDPFEVAHFTLRTNESRYYPLGRSILEGSRKAWKQLKILEDSLVINRLVRAPERRVFMIEVGNLSSAEAKQFLEEVKAEYNKKKFFNPTTGEIDEKASPLAQMEDFFIPVRQGAGSKIDTLPGSQNMDQIADVELFRSKMISALGIPPQYMYVAGGTNQGGNFDTKAGLSQQDIRFGRTVLRIQKSIVSTLYKICYIQLYLKGFGIQDIKSLEISMTPPNAIEESMRLDAINKRIDAASNAKATNLFSDKWVLSSIMLFDDNEIEEDLEQKQMEAKLGLSSEEGGAPGGGMGGAEEPAGAFDEFAEPAGEEPTSGPISVGGEAESEQGSEQAPEQEVASVQYDKSKLIKEDKNNKYFYKGGIFNHLLNENQFEGLIDLKDHDSNVQLIKEEAKAKTSDLESNE